jgi:hypothetical protein
LGHVDTKNGIKVNTENVNNFQIPKTAKQVKSFLGMALIASPLTSLLRKNQKFTWTLECQQAFDRLKEGLVSAPILAFPKFDKPFIL